MTPAQSDLLDRLTRALGQDSRIQALWLHGSLAHGGGDAWSDIDLVAQVDPADQAGCLKDYNASHPGLPERVHTLEVYGCIINSVTSTWERFDIVFLPETQIRKTYGAELKPLSGAAVQLDPKPEAETASGTAARVEALILEFLRVLGLGPVAVGRGEWIVGQQGHSLLRDMTVNLMLEGNGVPRAARGAKRLNEYLTPEQQMALEAITPPAANRESLVESQAAIGRLFLGEARSVAARMGIDWPEAFEAATRRHLNAELSLEI